MELIYSSTSVSHFSCSLYFQEISIFEIVLEQNNRNLNKINVLCLQQTSQSKFSSNLLKLFGNIKHIHKRIGRIQILTLKSEEWSVTSCTREKCPQNLLACRLGGPSGPFRISARLERDFLSVEAFAPVYFQFSPIAITDVRAIHT